MCVHRTKQRNASDDFPPPLPAVTWKKPVGNELSYWPEDSVQLIQYLAEFLPQVDSSFVPSPDLLKDKCNATAQRVAYQLTILLKYNSNRLIEHL